MQPISSVLIANRGEIAVRVIRTARAMGLRTIAVYSDADKHALHVREADAAVRIGPAPVADSYLNMDAVLAAATGAGADAIHPGYGFLSENQAFASACESAGIVFIGPPNTAIDVMGDKARAKRAMLAAGVPCVPGYQGDDQSVATLVAESQQIGMPVMVKAAAGGGGRGMRLVEDITQLQSAIEFAQSEAENAFGSKELIIEKAVIRPRHVEIQVFADRHGNVIHLGERDCSIQRRHQKVVEESPCPVMTPPLREAMGSAAVEAARAVDYVGAGTVEFLLDEGGDFYFLEMNTRLQVEHPVTELVTGFDLVEWQLRVARGEPLPVTQEQVALQGHAIEVRLYAEDPSQGFLPSTGPVRLFHCPDREGVRVDTGVVSGDQVSPFYDAMVAKIIGYGTNREDARLRLIAALSESALLGLSNNRDFLISALGNASFVSGEATTAFIGEQYGDSFAREAIPAHFFAAGAIISHQLARLESHARTLGVSEELLGWASARDIRVSSEFQVGEDVQALCLIATSATEFSIEMNGTCFSAVVNSMDSHSASLTVDGVSQSYQFYHDGPAALHLASSERTEVLIDLKRLPPATHDAAGSGTVTAPMHGLLMSVAVVEGQEVRKGERLAVLEAMKMQHELTAAIDGIVSAIKATEGNQLAAGDLILVIESSEGDDGAGAN